MIFPTTNLAILLLLTLTLICWGSWANMQKVLAKKKWRFELFYFDFMIGLVLTMVIAAFTAGSFNSQDLTFQDNLLITGYHKMAYAGGAGVLFGLGNFLLVGAVALGGMAVGFPVTFGTAGIIGIVLSYIAAPKTNATLIFGGAALFLVALFMTALAHFSETEALFANEQKPLRPDPRVKGVPSNQRIGPARAVVLAILGGVVIAMSRPLVEWAREGENGLSPYGLALLFGLGVAGGTIVASPFFINFPVTGFPAQVRNYFKGTLVQHLAGWFSGIVWAMGALGVWLSLAAPVSVQAGPALIYAFSEGSTILAALMGMLVWKDLSHGIRARMFALVGLTLFASAIGMVTSAYLK
jgi:glucose uptake protein